MVFAADSMKAFKVMVQYSSNVDSLRGVSVCVLPQVCRAAGATGTLYQPIHYKWFKVP